VSRGPAAVWLWRELEGAVLLKYWREEFFKKKKKVMEARGDKGRQRSKGGLTRPWKMETFVCP
jgi:hypothetical protein